jgi:hypothetical protein
MSSHSFCHDVQHGVLSPFALPTLPIAPVAGAVSRGVVRLGGG